ncbi:hypothetical protein SETIT_2G102300v2 [Setaria italica]|uniref:Uncharacterized protein n=1 Tax=Setaria italica TaxID=4555 RepID=A0A368PXE0_SETIT|nr:hypothetical protein SETIT_2G102300v2 [Setaria italica]
MTIKLSVAVTNCDQLILTCPFAALVWSQLGIDTRGCKVSAISTVPHPTRLPSEHFDCFLLLVTWQLWKHRKDMVLNEAHPYLDRLWTDCKQDTRLWSCRWPAADRPIADAWCPVFSSM